MEGSTEDYRVVVLGSTGTGKSSTINTLFKERVIEVKNSPCSSTSKCQAINKEIDGKNYTFVDTPGFFDTEHSDKKIRPEILRCLIECAPGPHAFLIVLKVEKYTVHVEKAIEKIKQYFSDEAFKYSTVLFTHGNELDEGQTIEDFVKESRPLSNLVKKCGGRCHVIDNKYWSDNEQDGDRSNMVQVKKLLNTVMNIVKNNGGRYFSNVFMEKVKATLTTLENKTGLAKHVLKNRFHSKLLIKLAGIGTGALLGLLFSTAGSLVIGGAAGGAVGVVGVLGCAVGGGIIGYMAVEDAKTVQDGLKKVWDEFKDIVNEILADLKKHPEEKVPISTFF